MQFKSPILQHVTIQLTASLYCVVIGSAAEEPAYSDTSLLFNSSIDLLNEDAAGKQHNQN